MIRYTILFLFIIVLFVTVQCQQNKTSNITLKNSATIQWSADLDAGLKISKEQNKPLMIEFTATWCPYCRLLEDSTFSHPNVIEKSLQFIPVQIDVDKQPEIASQYQANARKYGGSGIPNILFLNPDGEKIIHVIGYQDYQKFLTLMDSVLVVQQAQ